MNIVEALKLSKIIKFRGSEYNFEHTTYGLNVYDLMSEYWEPVLPEKKTVKKKLYQAVIYHKLDKSYFIPSSLFETPEEAEKYCLNYKSAILSRFLVENPIEAVVREVNAKLKEMGFEV